jgi:succinyl-CoA synthetase beta subunit
MKAEDAKTAAGELDGPLWVVKSQIHAGGRGKGKFKEKPKPAKKAACVWPSRSRRPRN